MKERIVLCRLKGEYVNVMVVQVYASTDEKPDEEKVDFCRRLGEIVRSVKRHDMLLLMAALLLRKAKKIEFGKRLKE